MFDLKKKAKRKLIDMPRNWNLKMAFWATTLEITQPIFYALSGTPSKKLSLDLNFSVDSKGQLISECLFGVLNFPKHQRKLWQIPALETKKYKVKALSDNTMILWPI